MPHDIVIARYAENLDWVGQIPAGFSVHVYNKGETITSAPALQRADRIVTLANSGRESDTYLRHILGTSTFSDNDGFTVFVQGDPFEHSPDLLALLHDTDLWQARQPLSWCWLQSKNLPPADILSRETSGFMAGSRVRAELFSLSSWSQLQFTDPGARTVCDMYLALHDLPEGTNIAAHFLHRCGLADFADQARQHLVGRFSYGALFGLRTSMLRALPMASLELALEAANGHKVYGYVLERLWLHLFGEPFVLPTTGTAAAAENVSHLATRFVPAAPPTPTHLRLVPAIKRRISRWAQN